MATLPPVIFEVTITVPAEMRAAMRAKGVIDDWLLSDAAGERPVAHLPSADLQMGLERSELKLSWLELEAANAWEAIQRATDIIAEIIPGLLRTRTLRIEASLQGEDADLRRPRGA